jgi:hypothetical protein
LPTREYLFRLGRVKFTNRDEFRRMLYGDPVKAINKAKSSNRSSIDAQYEKAQKCIVEAWQNTGACDDILRIANQKRKNDALTAIQDRQPYMSKFTDYTIAYSEEGKTYKIAKVIFGSDGSYYLTCPYHQTNTAFLCKGFIDADKTSQEFSLDEVPQSATVDDDEKRLKLSHHPDGWVQFSGNGFISGRGSLGRSSGINMESFPLTMNNRAGAFTITIRNPIEFKLLEQHTDRVCLFAADQMLSPNQSNLLIVEGTYFPEWWRRFVRTDHSGQLVLDAAYSGPTLVRWRVLPFPGDSKGLGLLGINAYRWRIDSHTGFDFIVSVIGKQIGEHNSQKQEALFCMYPRPPKVENAPSLHYRGFPTNRIEIIYNAEIPSTPCFTLVL